MDNPRRYRCTSEIAGNFRLKITNWGEPLIGFKDKLRNYFQTHHPSVIPEGLYPVLPRGFQDLNKHIILKLNPQLLPYTTEIANATLEILPRMKAVWLREGQIQGKFRQPSGLTHILGDPETEVIINENGVRYKFDFTQIMFAKGNIHERSVLPKRINPGEVIVDMFAGIGYFTLGMAKSKKPKKIYAMEWNPTAYKYLCENIKLNHVENIVEPLLGDNKELVTYLVAQGIRADRIIMGLLPAPIDAIEYALKLAKSSGIGTIVVYEGVEPKESTELYDSFQQIANQHNFSTELLERRIVKAFKPHEYHMVLEIEISVQKTSMSSK